MDWVGAVRPVMHLLFLIVSHSPYYNTFRRLNSLVRTPPVHLLTPRDPPP